MTGTSVRWLRLFVGGVVGSLMLSACAGGGGGGGTGGSPKPGGTLTIGMWQEPATMLGSITDNMTFEVAFDNMVVEGLLKGKASADVPKNPKLSDYFEPQLATEVPTAENGDVKMNSDNTMSVTWKLRHGVKWHDGVPFTSKDVKATFDLFWLKYKDKNPTALISTSGWDQVTSVDTPDDYTAVVHFGKIYAPYLTLGTGPYGIVPEHLLSQVWAKSGDMTKEKLTVNIPGAYSGTDTMDKFLVGTGPYMFKEWVSGDHATLVRNPSYWEKGQNGAGPYLDKIVVKFEPDTNTQLADLRTGTIDLGLDFRAALLSPLGRLSSTITTVTLPDSGAEHLDVNLHNPLLSDPVLRRAILMGIDRQKIIDTLLEGKTVLTPDSWLCVGTGQWCQDPNGKRTNFDPAGAKKLLENAGYKMQSSGNCSGYYANPKGQCVSLHLSTTSGNALREEQEVVIQNDLKAIGIQILTPFVNYKAGKLFGSFQDGGILYTHNFDLAQYTNTYSFPAEPDAYYPGYVSTQIPTDANGGSGQNSTYCSDPKIDDAFNRARATVKTDERKQGYIDAQKQLANDLCDIPLYQQLTVNAYTKKLQGYKGNEFYWLNNSEDWYLSS